MRTALNRAMSRADLVAIVINAVVGAGVLGLPGRMFATLGYYSIAAWAGCAVIMALIALCFAEVAGQFTRTGGVYLYAYTAIGARTGFVVGWLAWVSRLFSLAAICNLVINYVSGLDARLTAPGARVACVTIIFALLTWPLLIGIRRSTRVNNLLTAIKLLVFGGFIVTLLWFDGQVNAESRPVPSMSAWQAAMLQMSFAFIGVESAMINAGEMRNPTRDPPFALGVGLIIIASLYISIQAACIGVVPDLATSERPVVEAATRVFGPWGGRLIGVGGVICMLGTMYAVIFTGSRLPFALAECRQLPAALARVSARSGTPVVAVLLTSMAAWAVTLYTSFLGAVTVTATTRLVGYVTTAIALILLRRQRPRAGFRVWAGSLVASIAIGACLWLMSATSQSQWLGVMAIVLVGLLVHGAWALTGRWNDRKQTPT